MYRSLPGSAPRHIIVTCGNRLFKVVPFDADTAPWPVNKLEAFFHQLDKYVENNPRDDTISVGQLTAADRTSWARVSRSLDIPI